MGVACGGGRAGALFVSQAVIKKCPFGLCWVKEMGLEGSDL